MRDHHYFVTTQHYTASLPTLPAEQERTPEEIDMYRCYVNYIKQKGYKRQYHSIAAELAYKASDTMRRSHDGSES